MLDLFDTVLMDDKNGEHAYQHKLIEEQIKEAETYAKSVKVRREPEDGQLAKGSPRVSARNRSTKDQTNEPARKRLPSSFSKKP